MISKILEMKKIKKILGIISGTILAATFLWLVSPIQSIAEEGHSKHEIKSEQTHEAAGHAESGSEAHENASSAQEGHQPSVGHEDAGHGAHHEEARILTPEVSDMAKLPIYIILVPIFGAFLYLACAKQSYTIRSIVSVAPSAIVFALMIYLYKYIVPGVYIGGHLYKGIQYTLPYIPNFNFSLKIDPANYAIAMVSAFVWFVAMIYGIDYMTIEKKVNRYNFFAIISLAAQIGVMMAGDFLTLFIFFEGLVFLPYSMVVHHEDKDALSGANIFLYMSVATGLFLLMGIMLLWYLTGSVEIKACGDILNKGIPGLYNPVWLKYAMAFFLIFGFGGKAGLFFEHAWLPKAHPVAPTPGSACLSGLMIKAGAYGIFRSLNLLYTPGSFSAPDWFNMVNIGYIIIWVGILTMFMGVVNALLSENSKRMLAYHSVSQMGYIVMGIGCAAYLGKDGAMGLAGAIYHIINHALFKALLFFGVGAAYFRTHELNMYKLGGLWRNMPIAAIGTMIAVFGIAGIPGFNGFASKTLLHHSILEAYEHSVHYSHNGKPDIWLRVAEIMFMITAGGTFASNIKMGILTFFGKRNKKFEKVKDIQLPMKIAIIMLSAAIIFIGLNPNWMLETVIGPALAYFNFDPASHPYHIIYNVHATGNAIKSTIPILYDPVTKALFSSSEVIHNILGGSNAILLGGIIFILGFRLGWFHMPDSEWLTVEFYYKGIYKTFKRFCTGVIVEESELISNKEVYVFRRNYENFVKFCKGTLPDVPNVNTESDRQSMSVSKVSDWIEEKEIDFFSNNYENFVKFCKGSLPDTPDMQPGFADGAVGNFSDWVEKEQVGLFTAGYHGFVAFCRNTIGRLSYYINHWVLFLMVDVWLATTHSRSVYKRFDDAFSSWYGGELVVDKKLADTYLKICQGAANFDYNFIDGIVNGVAWFIHTYGRGMRRIQTGYIQNYALSIVIGIVALVSIYIIII